MELHYIARQTFIFWSVSINIQKIKGEKKYTIAFSKSDLTLIGFFFGKEKILMCALVLVVSCHNSTLNIAHHVTAYRHLGTPSRHHGTPSQHHATPS